MGALNGELPPGQQGDGLPDYYRQNFHFQSDGWLSEHSAAIYDTQVEVLFTGAADVMRRRAFKPIAEWMAGRNQRELKGLEELWPKARTIFTDDTWGPSWVDWKDQFKKLKEKLGEPTRVR